jgi:hypothetical protein
MGCNGGGGRVDGARATRTFSPIPARSVPPLCLYPAQTRSMCRFQTIRPATPASMGISRWAFPSNCPACRRGAGGAGWIWAGVVCRRSGVIGMITPTYRRLCQCARTHKLKRAPHDPGILPTYGPMPLVLANLVLPAVGCVRHNLLQPVHSVRKGRYGTIHLILKRDSAWFFRGFDVAFHSL